jgi:hypothetical protein
VLSVQEQRVWDDVQRFWAEEVDEPPRAAPVAPTRRGRSERDRAVLQVAVVVGARITIVLLLLGALLPGLAVGVATALGWALGQSRPQPPGQGAPDTPPDGGADRTERRPAADGR